MPESIQEKEFFSEVAGQQCAAAIASVLGTSTVIESWLGVTHWKSESPAKYCDKQHLPFSLAAYLS